MTPVLLPLRALPVSVPIPVPVLVLPYLCLFRLFLTFPKSLQRCSRAELASPLALRDPRLRSAATIATGYGVRIRAYLPSFAGNAKLALYPSLFAFRVSELLPGLRPFAPLSAVRAAAVRAAAEVGGHFRQRQRSVLSEFLADNPAAGGPEAFAFVGALV